MNANNVITNTGKPWYGIIKKVGGSSNNQNKLTVTAYPVYGVIGNDTDTTYNPVETSGNKPGLMTVADKAKLDDIQDQANNTSATSNSDTFTTENNNNNTLNITDAVATTEAYNIGSVTPGTGDNSVVFKGKNTTYGKATNEKYGLVKLGDNTRLGPINSTTKVYPVQATEDGNLGVYVPWTDDQALPKTLLAVAGDGNSNSHTAVDTGPVYINTYEATGTNNKTHTGAISIEGKNGISVTADNGGKIEISGHEKPANLGGKTGDGLLVPEPSSTISTDGYFLTAKGNWAKPTDTKVTYRVNGTDKVITSLASGTGISFGLNGEQLTINGPASGRAAKAGTGLTEDDSKSTTERYLNLKGATFDTVSDSNIISGLGGIKIGTGGSKQFNYTWNNPGEAETGWSASTTDIPVTVYQPNRANGKYYPVECTKDSAAVVCIPNVPSPFYDNTDKTIYVDSSSLRELKMFFKQPVRAESVDGVIKWFAKEGEDGSYIFSETEPVSPTPNNVGDEGYIYENTGVENCIFPIIHFPSTVIFAELQATSSEGGVLSARLGEHNGNLTIDASDIGCAVFPGFDGSSIKAGNPVYAYLRFTTVDHTYNATIKIGYNVKSKKYSSDIII